MDIRSKYTFALITVLVIMSISCSRELTNRDERPQSPFPFDRIPALSSDDTIGAGQTSGVNTESTVGSESDIVAQEPGDAALEALIQAGRQAIMSNDYQTAVNYFTEVINRDPNNTTALYNLGYSYRYLKDYEKAVEYSLKAVESDPDRLYVHQNLAFAYLEQGNTDAAIAEFEEELLRHPNETLLAGVAERLAKMYMEKGLMEEAFDAANRSVTLEPEVASHQSVLGEVHIANGAFSQAITVLEKAVALDPENGPCRKLLGDALWGAGRQAEAQQRYNEAIGIDPSLVDHIPAERLANSGDPVM